MNSKSIKQHPDFLDFCKRRNLKSSTINRYVIALHKYSDLIDLDIDEMIEEAEEEEDLGLRLRKRKIRKHLIKFKEYLDNRKYSENYKIGTLSMVRAFYSEYDITLPKNFKRKARSDRKPLLFEDLPSMEEIKYILQYAKPVFRSMILLGVSSGMSTAELLSLTFDHLYDAMDLSEDSYNINELIDVLKSKSEKIPFWNVIRIKTTNHYFTFSSPESIVSLINYLEDLNRLHNKKYKTDIEITPKTKLFLNNRFKSINENLIQITYRRLNEKAGYKRPDGTNYIRPHVLRKVFASTLERNKMPHLMTRWLMGHKLDPTTSAYFKANPETLKEEYIQIVEQLNVNQDIEIKTVTTEGYDQLLIDSKDKGDQIEAMKKQIKEMEIRNKERDEFLDDLMTKKNVVEKILEEDKKAK